MTLSNTKRKKLRRSYGDWALVTGASTGIGKAFAEQLARSGFNLIICSRSNEDLDRIKDELCRGNAIEVITVATDLGDHHNTTKLLQACDDYSPGLIVASAGFGTSGKFQYSKLENEIDMLNVNCLAPLQICHWAAQKKNSSKRRAVVLLSSIVAFQGVPSAAHYSATKAYIQSLAEGLSGDFSSLGIDIVAAAPGPVRSKFAERADMKLGATVSPGRVAEETLGAIGRKTTVRPGLLTKLLTASLCLPRHFRTMIMTQVMGRITKHQNHRI